MLESCSTGPPLRGPHLHQYILCTRPIQRNMAINASSKSSSAITLRRTTFKKGAFDSAGPVLNDDPKKKKKFLFFFSLTLSLYLCPSPFPTLPASPQFSMYSPTATIRLISKSNYLENDKSLCLPTLFQNFLL